MLKGVLKKDRKSKLNIRWTRPLGITERRDKYIFGVEQLSSKKKELLHGRILHFFKHSDLEITEEVQNYL